MLCVIVLLLSGCWDRMEIEDRAVILAIAVDEVKNEQQESDSNATHLGRNLPRSKLGLIRVTVQIAVPGRIPLGQGGSGGGGGGGSTSIQQKTVWVLSATGHTIDDALTNLQQQMADRLFYGHLRVIVISEEIAKRGIENLSDFLRRQPQVRRTVWMVVSQGDASHMMTATPQLERVPTLYLLSTMEHAVEMGKFPNDILGVFWSASSAKGQEGFLPYLRLKKSDNVEILGLAYFKGDKMVGTTEALDIGFYMAIKNINPGGYNVIMQGPQADSTVMVQATRRHSNIHVDIRNGRPHVRIRVQTEADVREKGNEKFTLTKENIDRLNRTIEQQAAEGYKKLIKRTQEQGADIFGFGEYVRAKLPGYWNREIRTKENWQKMYKNVAVDVESKAKIRRIGTKVK